jgi:hypothetical protein
LNRAPTTAAALTLALCACDRPAEAPNAQGAAAPPNAPAASPLTPKTPTPLFFVGRWAADTKLCDKGAWVITVHGVETAGEVSCKFEGPPQGAGSVEVDAVCTAQAPPKRYRLRFSYAQSAKALLVENGPFADMGLIRCPGPAYPEVEPRPPGSPGALPDDRTPVSEAPVTPTSAQGAADVVQRYFALIQSGRYAEALKLRAPPPEEQALAAGLDAYDSLHGLVGAPGRVEGGAGSLSVEVPVQLYGRLKDGREVHQGGVAVLRRANETPGATAEQRLWRIHDLRLKDAP